MALNEKVILFNGSLTGDGNSVAVDIPLIGENPPYFLSAVASAVGAGTSLVAKLQHSCDGGTTWFDVASLTALTSSALSQGSNITVGILNKARINFDFTGGTTTATLVVALHGGVSK